MLGVADGKVIIERLCISLPYVETLNSKVIKGFVPKLRSRECFEIPVFYVYMLCMCEHSVCISRVRIVGMVHDVTVLHVSPTLSIHVLIYG